MEAANPITPRVSVIIPAYNTAPLIAACLDSVFAQTYTDFEAIVVNDGSPDTEELERVLQPYLPRIVYLKQPNKRAAGARNTAIQAARGEFLAFLDSDDVWYREHLANQMQLFDEDPQLDLVYANSLVTGDAQREWEFMQRCRSEGKASFEALVVEDCQIPVSTVVARKSALEKAGLFDESLARCDDYDMWLRAAYHGAKIGYRRSVQAKLAGTRPDSLGQSSAKMAEAYWLILEKAERALPLTDAQRSVVRDRAARIKAHYLLEEGKFQLDQGDFAKARELLGEANRYLHRPKLDAVLLGLRVAPNVTRRLASYWSGR
jgi:GT2 family glycosyltransferase